MLLLMPRNDRSVLCLVQSVSQLFVRAAQQPDVTQV